MSFEHLGLRPEILRALEGMNHKTPTPVQKEAIPRLLEGRDLLGCARTGTGKTAAFALPILQRLIPAAPQRNTGRKCGPRRQIRVLVLTPTRELCGQVTESFAAYGKHTGLKTAAVYGGVSQSRQEEALRRGVDILVATPGRLLDLESQKILHLGAVGTLVLDEADRMLDMGFLPDVRRIISLVPEDRQTLLFSATIPGEILKLAGKIMRDPVRVTVSSASSPAAENVEHLVYYVEKQDKAELLRRMLSEGAARNALVFTRTKRGADRLADQLVRANIRSEAIHGDRSQSARERALAKFKSGATRVLVATDVAARGLDIAELSHVFNFDLPAEPENYVHRIGRTGRAGASGTAVSFCGIEERALLTAIERMIRKHLKVVEDHPFRSFLRPGIPTRLDNRPARPVNARFMIPATELFRAV
ncbi:MAG: DEAD/DEAH box helicase [Deltaproteobacteria bacterium]|nr:DEAD/DEAH box helicase [Deltaproteobacteria bacterium]